MNVRILVKFVTSARVEAPLNSGKIEDGHIFELVRATQAWRSLRNAEIFNA